MLKNQNKIYEFSACLAPTTKTLINRDRMRVQLPPPHTIYLLSLQHEGISFILSGFITDEIDKFDCSILFLPLTYWKILE